MGNSLGKGTRSVVILAALTALRCASSPEQDAGRGDTLSGADASSDATHQADVASDGIADSGTAGQTGCHTTVCDDGNACTDDSCIEATGKCAYEPKACPAATEPCSQTVCDPKSGCGEKSLCDDDDACTVDTCDKSTSTCSHAEKCQDPNVCSKAHCWKGTCSTYAKCGDGKKCTTDICDPVSGACSHTTSCAPTSAPCTTSTCFDSTGCVLFDACTDDDPCTAESCDAKTGQCVHKPIADCWKIECEHDCDCVGLAGCIQAACVAGTCSYEPKNWDCCVAPNQDCDSIGSKSGPGAFKTVKATLLPNGSTPSCTHVDGGAPSTQKGLYQLSACSKPSERSLLVWAESLPGLEVFASQGIDLVRLRSMPVATCAAPTPR